MRNELGKVINRLTSFTNYFFFYNVKFLFYSATGFLKFHLDLYH